MDEISLTMQQIRYAGLVGFERQLYNLSVHAGGAGHINLYPWQNHIEAALSEYAVSLMLELPWTGIEVGDYSSKDVGPYQVRRTPPDRVELNVRVKDDPEDVFILVSGQDGRYYMRGWMLCADAQIPEYFRETQYGTKVYTVKLANLHPMIELPAPQELGWHG